MTALEKAGPPSFSAVDLAEAKLAIAPRSVVINWIAMVVAAALARQSPRRAAAVIAVAASIPTIISQLVASWKLRAGVVGLIAAIINGGISEGSGDTAHRDRPRETGRKVVDTRRVTLGESRLQGVVVDEVLKVALHL